MKDLIVKQVKKLLKDAITRFAKEAKCEKNKLLICIYCDDYEGIPLLKLYSNSKFHKNIKFSDLYTKFQQTMYNQGFGFDLSKELPNWVQKFILKASNDYEVDITKTKYLLSIFNNDLKAFMYVDNKQTAEIEINYILETK